MAKAVAPQLAEAIADGTPVDWKEVDRRVKDPAERRVVEGLRSVDELAATTSGTRLADTSVDTERFTNLALRAIVALAVARIALAVGGVLAGPPLAQEWVAGGRLGLVAATFAATGLWLVTGSAGDRRASTLGGFFLTCGAALAHRFVLRWEGIGILDSWAFVLRGVLPEAFFPVFLWRFAATFPRVLRLTRLDAVLRHGTRIAWVTCGTAFAVNLAAALVDPRQPHRAPVLGLFTRDSDNPVYWIALFLAVTPAIVLMWVRRRAAAAGERRRVAFFLASLILGFAPLLLYVLSTTVPVAYAFVDAPENRPAVLFAVHVGLLTMPLTAAYAVFAQSLFSVRMAAAALLHAVLSPGVLAPALVVSLVGLVLSIVSRRSDSVDALLASPPIHSWTLLTVTLVFAVLLRRRVLRLVDARLLEGAAIDAAVRLTSEHLQQAPSDALTVEVLQSAAAKLLRARFAAVIETSPGPAHRPMAGRVRPLPDSSLVATLVKNGRRSIVVDPDAPESVFGLLPESERHWVLDSRAGVLVGLGGGVAGHRLLCIGPGLSGVPPGPRERRALEALASAASLILENRALRVAAVQGVQLLVPEEGASVCGRCGTIAGAPAGTCPCGGETVEGPLPLILAGKFRLLRRLGRGGMGVVFEAEDLDLGRHVALKTLPHVSSTLALRLRAEARAMGALVHPHLAFVYGLESWKGTPVLVIEYLPGGTLADRLQRGVAAVADVVRWGPQLARATAAVHARNLLHRDIKPSNMGFAADESIKLLDFGLARLLDVSTPSDAVLIPSASATLTGAGRVAGTPLYLSPEALAGDPPSEMQDLWALSLSLYEALCGTAVLRRILREGGGGSSSPLPDVRELRADCPAGLAELLASALAEDPRRRPRTAVHLAEDLERVNS